jgi:hypothetical protein
MSRTIKAIECRMISPVRPQTRRGEFVLESRSSKLVGEWQQRGPETSSGNALRKLRLVLAPTQSTTFAGAVA